METLLIMLKNVIIFVLLAVPGYILVKSHLLKSSQSGGLSKLLTYVGMPFLILSSTLKLEFSGSFTVSLVLCGIIGMAFTLVMFAITALLVRDKANEKRRGVARFCMIFSNNGFIGIPLAKAIFGDGSAVMAYLIILNIVTNVLLFTVGIYLISGDKKAISLKKALLSPVLVAFVVGLILNFAGINRYLPEAQTYATYFSNIVTPLSMTILGMKLASIALKRLFSSWRMYYVSAVRLVIFPVLGVCLLFLLRLIPALTLPDEMILACFVAFAMPTAGLASAFADQFDGDTENAVIFTLGATILSVVTIPILYWLLRTMI